MWREELRIDVKVCINWVFELNTGNFDRLYNTFRALQDKDNSARMTSWIRKEILHDNADGVNIGPKWWQDPFSGKAIDHNQILIHEMEELGTTDKILVCNMSGVFSKAIYKSARRPTRWHGCEKKEWDEYCSKMQQPLKLFEADKREMDDMYQYCMYLYEETGEKEPDIASGAGLQRHPDTAEKMDGAREWH